MKILQKEKNRDFKILNLSDPQMTSHDWKSEICVNVIKAIMDELIEKEKPDLITVSGDLNVAGDDEGYYKLTDFIDSYGLPWAFVWGNHDNQDGNDYLEKLLPDILKHKNVIFERGDPAYGNGNYVIGINEGDKPVTALFMLDAHDRDSFVDENGNVQRPWAKLWDNQIEWFKSESKEIQSKGYKDSALILHIPIYGYRKAFDAAFSKICEPNKADLHNSEAPEYWNEGYRDSFGIRRENICSSPFDEGMFEVLKELDFTKHVIAGHDHVNNFSILYDGIRLTYSMKLGIGCYADWDMQGGTYITVGSDGIKDVHHRLVDIMRFKKD